ncbi:hypothetical protein KQI89_08680 [Clostridium sp. MSJ-4]|uniref:Uncharacterized protein n=1 Tax=Clostridium simiarum TaxID=2841506 RepID=A0ABS6F040_9CLOT|nr:hypothetical protein [Clostridium simiarum]MBU5591840.1 hypothetical protein [Clostridium simiarum]
MHCNGLKSLYFRKFTISHQNSFIRRGENEIKEALYIDNMGKYFNEWTEDLNECPANHIPIAIYSKMDFSHRICRQSGKFTFHGPKGPLNYAWDDTVVKAVILGKLINW